MTDAAPGGEPHDHILRRAAAGRSISCRLICTGIVAGSAAQLCAQTHRPHRDSCGPPTPVVDRAGSALRSGSGRRRSSRLGHEPGAGKAPLRHRSDRRPLVEQLALPASGRRRRSPSAWSPEPIACSVRMRHPMGCATSPTAGWRWISGCDSDGGPRFPATGCNGVCACPALAV